MKLRHLSVAAILAAVLPLSAYAAGIYPNYPGVGVGSFCAGTIIAGVPGTAGVCSSTVPAGPSALTGSEYSAFDTALSQGQAPQTVNIQTGLLMPGNSGANALTGSDFGLNLWQRGTTTPGLAPSTATYVADGWYAYSSGNTVSISKQTGSTDIPTALSPTLASMRINRPSSSSNTTAICVGQILPAKESQRFIGNTGIFSTYMLAGSGFSPTNNNVTMTIAYYTAADSATAGTNTGTFASSIGATQNITGYTELVNAVTPISTTWTRYSTSASIPATNAAGTAVTGVGVKLCYTPVGTGSATDYFEVANPQFEPRVGTSTAPSAFNRRLPTEEWQLEYSRFFEILETQQAGRIHGAGQATATTIGEAYLQYPVEQRLLIPTATYTAGFAVTASTGAITTCTGLTSGANTITPLGVGAACTVSSGLTAGNAVLFVDNAGSGVIQVSSEP